jgi:hypothetical protein
MVHEIVIGRNERDLEKYGTKGAIDIGKQYIEMGKTVSLSNKILLDVVRPHVIMISGKRGSGKSYTMGVMAEAIASMPQEVRKNLSCLIIDTMGIYWTMKEANFREERLLEEWDIEPKGFENVQVFVPSGKFDEYKTKDIPVDHPFSLTVSEMSGPEWNMIFGFKPTDPHGSTVERVVMKLKKGEQKFDIDNIINFIQNDPKTDEQTKNSLINRFESVKTWGLFQKDGTKIEDILKPGTISVIDVSVYLHLAGAFSIRALVIGLLNKKILEERMMARKMEEMQELQRAWAYKDKEKKIPLVWIFIDEAHEFLPRDGETVATAPLVQSIREGRQPGISMVLATQQPGKLHTDVLTQADLIISHRVTSKLDVEALNTIMQTYLPYALQKYLDLLPNLPGSAIVLDDNQERIYPIQVKPRQTWHGGETPKAMPPEKRGLLS